MRSLISEIRMVPAAGADALTPPTTAGTPEGDRLEGIDSIGELVLVAGACNRRSLPDLKCVV